MPPIAITINMSKNHHHSSNISSAYEEMREIKGWVEMRGRERERERGDDEGLAH
jgi:hypothetical protein